MLNTLVKKLYISIDNRMKRLTDIVLSSIGLITLSPFLIIILFLIFLNDRHSPFYIAERVGKDENVFKMIKIRSMVINADSSGVDSTGEGDKRITKLGHFVRKYKIDEVPALWEERSEGESRFKILKWLPQYLKWYIYGLSTTWLKKKKI